MKRELTNGFRHAAVWAVLFCLSILIAPAAVAQPLNLKGLDRYIEKARQAWQIPGLSIAIVYRDSVIFAKGYGVRELGKPEPVTPHTVFAIASNSKAFTAAALGMLVDEGKLSWDDRVVDHLPEFQLYDPFATRDMRVRDLLCHRSGLPTFGGDHLWIASTLDTREIMRRLRYLKPSAPLRARFQYQNLMFMVAGEVLRAVSGRSWAEFIQTRILEPLGMKESNTSIRFLKGHPQAARAHETIDGRIRVVPYDSVDAVAAAGAINASVLDMTRWMRLNLNMGELEGKRLFSKRVAREMQTIHTPIPVSEFEERTYGRRFRGYGLGWNISDYHGHKIVQHGGGLTGMISLQTLVPEKQFGVMIMTNYSPNSLPRALTYRILDELFGLPPRDWSRIFLQRQEKEKAAEREREKALQEQRIQGTRPSLNLEQYVGIYSNPLSGEARIELVNGRLKFYYNPRHQGYLEHWHYDTFRLTWINPIFDMPGKAFLTFYLDESGRVVKLRTRFYHPIEFERIGGR